MKRGTCASQVGNREASLPADLGLVAQGRHDGVDHHGQRDRRLGALVVGRDLDDREAQPHVDLRRGEADALVLVHGLDHVVDEPLDVGRADGLLRHGAGGGADDGVSDARDLQDGHGILCVLYRRWHRRPACAGLVPRTTAMFIGHFAVAFAAKKIEPRVSLGTTFAAAQLADVVWPVFVLAGIERVTIAPGDTAVTPLRFESYPCTHSLVAAVLWGAAFGGLHYLSAQTTTRGAAFSGCSS